MLTPRSSQQPTMPILHLEFKNTLLKPFGEFGIFGARATLSPCMALQYTLLCSELQHFCLFGLTVCWAHKLVFGNKFII